MPSTEQLTGMRARYEARLPRTCKITPYSGASTDDAYGGFSVPGGTEVTGVRYSYEATAGKESLQGGTIAEIGNYILRFGTDVTLTPKATITDEVNTSKVFYLVAPLDAAQQIGQRWLATTRS